MEAYNPDTDLSPYGPTAFAQDSAIFIIESSHMDINTVANVLGSLLSSEQRATSRLAELPATSASSRLVLETIQVQAVGVLLLWAPTLRNEFSISLVPEVEISYEEWILAREAASLADWGLGTPATTAGPAATVGEASMDLDGNGDALAGDFVDDHTIVGGTNAPSPPPAVEAPVPLDGATISMIEDGLLTMLGEMTGGMGASTSHPHIVEQEQDEDEEDMDDEELEMNIQYISNALELDLYASNSGNETLDAMEMNTDLLQNLIHPPG
ncbi:hypothetical protein FRC00_007744, partial [Tulasnella sp. 408]